VEGDDHGRSERVVESLLDQITPIILPIMKRPTSAGPLEQLRWAKDIVVVDSFSDDATVEIVTLYYT
jgi:glycosyltransferase involved in cell wall biosynthesis